MQVPPSPDSPNESRTGETVSRIAALLKERILDGRIAPGQRLISNDVCEEFGVSRGPVREAFRQLDAERLIDLEPHKGATVRRLTVSEIKDLYQIRVALEGYAARLAAEKIGEGRNRAMLTEVLRRGRRHKRNPVFSAFVVDNRAFHQAIVQICGNEELGKLIDKYQLPVFMIQLRQVIGTDHVIRNALQEHEEIAKAILEGSPEDAYLAMQRHLQHSSQQLLDSPALRQAGPALR